MRKYSAALAAGAGVLLLALTAQSQEPPKVTLAQMATLYRQVMHRTGGEGSAADATATFRLESEADRNAFTDPVTDAQLRCQFPELQGVALGQVRAALLEALASASPVRFEAPDRANCIVAAPDRLAAIAVWHASLARVNSTEFLQTALIHLNATRRVEDRYHWSQRIANCRDFEQFRIVLALQSGSALWLTRRLAEKNGTQAFVPLLAEVYAHVPDEGPDKSARFTRQHALFVRHRAAVEGLSFLDRLARDWTELDAVVTHPPPHYEWILRPCTFRDFL